MSGPRAHPLSRRSVLTHWGALVGGVVASSLLQACGPSAPTSGSATAPTAAAAGQPVATLLPAPAANASSGTKTLQFAEALEPKSYDGINGSVAIARQGIGETLVRIGFSSQIEPALATALDPVDTTTWRFTLRDGVKFHDGSLLNPDAVKASIERLASRSDSAQGVQGATVTVDGPNSGRIQTTKPVPYLPALLADSAASILTTASYGSDGAITQPVGTGPFKFVSWSPGDRVVLQSHDAYWRGAPKIQSVQYRFVPQAQTRGNLLRTGEADITNVIAATDVPALKTAPGVTVMTNPDPRFRAAYINTQNGPTSDVRVRQALAHATDRDVIVNTLLQNQGTVQAAIFRSEYPWSNPAIKGLPLDPERAKSLLADAGFGTSNPLSITILTYNARPELPLIAQVLQQQWATVGVNCQISIQESAAIETIAFKQGTHNIALYSRSPLLVYDPQVIYETDFTSTGSYNLSRYSAQDAKIKAAGSMTDTNARYDQYRQIEQQIIEGDVALVVISGYVDIDGVHSGVTGYQQHPTQLLALTEMIDKA